jgi:hypothetical protein
MAANDVVRRELGVTRREGLDGLMLGELIGVLRRLNNRVGADAGLTQRLQDRFGRDAVLPEPLLGRLEAACGHRAVFVHDKVKRGRKDTVDIGFCRNILEEILDIAKTFETSQIYPCLVRIKREVTDEYGRTYVETVDETDRALTIKSRTWLRPEVAYFMHRPAGAVAIDPVIIERFI